MCHSKTRVELLQDIEDWSEDSQGRPIFWLKGLAGTGKSTIARTIASKFDVKQRLGASFFFARGQGDRGHAKMFFTTLAFQLSALSESLGYTISEAIGASQDIVNKRCNEQWRHLICEPLEKFPFHRPMVIVIDALDECDNEQDVRELLRVISQVESIHACSLRFFITSRPEIPVKHGFDNMPYVRFRDYALHETDDCQVKHDIMVYLTSELENINRKYSSRRGDWPSQEDICCLAGQAGKFFIYAATACRFIDQGGPPLFKERLADILEDDSDGSEEIDKMYAQILDDSIRKFLDKEKRRFLGRFQCIVGALVLLFSPLGMAAMNGLLSELSQITTETIQRTLLPFGSILDIPESEDIPISPFHLSFRDFLLNEERCMSRASGSAKRRRMATWLTAA
jgi:NACHT domain